jgi:spore coat protein U-like protein
MRTASLALALAGVFSAGSAFAGASPQTGTLNVSASVAASCVVVGGNMNFGAYDPSGTNFAAPLDVDGSLQIRCTKGTVAHVWLGQGANPNGGSCSAPVRQMASGAERLQYDLYRTAARTAAVTWGCTAATEALYTSAASNVNGTMTVFGRVPQAQDVSAGSFADTVSIDITF